MHDRDLIIRGKRRLSLWKGPVKPLFPEKTMTIEEKIESIKNEIEKLQSEWILMEGAQATYPDLKVHTNRWNKVRYTSAKAIALADKCDIAHNCGCCNDSPIELWPYMEYKPGGIHVAFQIYAEGIPFRIGEKCWCYGEKEYEGWQDKLRAKGLREEIIQQATKFFEDHPCTCGQETDD
jgi:hypothetical protein